MKKKNDNILVTYLEEVKKNLSGKIASNFSADIVVYK